jgi:NAD-dependent SIR2 family protein deacetylase
MKFTIPKSEGSSMKCKSCHEQFNRSDFDDVDYEFNESNRLCPNCEEQKDLEGQECEFCENPAVVHLDHYLCQEHMEGYYPSDD